MATAAAAPFSTDTPSNFFLNCPLLFSAFPHLPFTSPPSSPRPNLLSSTVDRFLRKVSDAFAADQKPFFQRLLSPFSEARLHAFSQMNAYHWKYLDGVSILVRDFSLKGVISCTGNMIHFRHCGSPNSLSAHNFAAILPGDTVAGVVVANGILNFLNIYNSLLVVRLVLTWFPNSPPAIVSPLSTICDPYLNIFRGIIPPLGGTLDLSPILAFLVLNAFTSAAAALPAELPVSGMPQHLSSSHPQLFSLTRLQKKWVRRVSGKGSKESDESS